ncbi:hypothetical protein LXA43DRAFT_206864 [Ganoderma leucocontextum]|nr:hypothetical protein LXA43DRAFT_206864 [Ganoderma leucocontextum]
MTVPQISLNLLCFRLRLSVCLSSRSRLVSDFLSSVTLVPLGIRRRGSLHLVVLVSTLEEDFGSQDAWPLWVPACVGGLGPVSREPSFSSTCLDYSWRRHAHALPCCFSKCFALAKLFMYLVDSTQIVGAPTLCVYTLLMSGWLILCGGREAERGAAAAGPRLWDGQLLQHALLCFASDRCGILVLALAPAGVILPGEAHRVIDRPSLPRDGSSEAVCSAQEYYWVRSSQGPWYYPHGRAGSACARRGGRRG